MIEPPIPDFHKRQTLLDHVRHTLSFYDPRAFDASGGFYHFLKDDGAIYDSRTRHLVSSTRYVFLWAMAAMHFPAQPHYLDYARHALEFLHRAHRDPESGGYAWQLDWDGHRAHVLDSTNHCYGLAFVLLAHSKAYAAGIDDAHDGIAATFELMERRFWEPDYGLYADQADAAWNLDSYRGQNANMHATEACLAAFEATGAERYLERARTIADSIVRRQTSTTGGLIWEHYRADWTIDWDYNRNDRTNIFRPWGYQPGHFTEWARLLVQLEHYQPADWLLPQAQALFRIAMDRAWDRQHGGLYYGFAPDSSICDDDKYHWVQAETLATAAVLGHRTGDDYYWGWYDRLWAYCWRYWIDHRHGAWFRLLRADNVNKTDEKSPAGKVDYHTTGACYAVLPTLQC